MSRNIIIGIVLVVLAVGGVTGYLLMSGEDSDSASSTAQSEQSSSTEQKSSASTSGNVFSLAEAGKAQQCTFSYSGSNGTGNGTMYSDGKGRGLMTIDIVTEKGNTGSSNTLLASDKVYSWTTSNGQTFGFVADKSTFSSSSDSLSTSTSSTSQNSDASRSYTIKCKSWSVDEAKLTPPSGVNFQAMPTPPAQ